MVLKKERGNMTKKRLLCNLVIRDESFYLCSVVYNMYEGWEGWGLYCVWCVVWWCVVWWGVVGCGVVGCGVVGWAGVGRCQVRCRA